MQDVYTRGLLKNINCERDGYFFIVRHATISPTPPFIGKQLNSVEHFNQHRQFKTYIKKNRQIGLRVNILIIITLILL